MLRSSSSRVRGRVLLGTALGLLFATACAIAQTPSPVGTGGGSGSCSGSFCSATAPLSGVLGGTGIANTGHTLTFAGNIATTGANPTTFALGATGRTYTFPDVTDSVVLLTATQTLTNKTLTSPVLGGTVTGNNTVPLGILAQSGANTMLGNWTSGTANVAANAMPSCPDSGGNHLNYVTNTGVTCGTGGGGSVSISSTSPQLVLTPNPMLTTATIDLTVARNAQTGTTYTLLAGDAGKVVSLSNAASIAVTVPQATGSFAAGYGAEFQDIGAGVPTLTTSTSVFDNGLGTLIMAKGQSAYIWSDSTNWHSVLSLPVVATSTLLGNSSGASNYPVAQTMGSGVITALGVALSGAGGVTTTVVSGTSALGTSAISSGACASVVTTAATGAATTDTVLASFNGDPTGVTGYAPTTNGMLTIIGYPSANNVNFKVCNNTSASVTPGAITLNWRILR